MRTISALNIPHSSIVFDLHQITEIQAELLGGNGIATEKIKHANLVSFTCLKSFAFDQRFERKDAHDLIYCIEHAPEGMDAVAEAFRKECGGKHGAVIEASLAILRGEAETVLAGGQSGHPLSRLYDDQVMMWREGVYHLMPWSREAVEKVTEYRLRMEPGQSV